MRKPLLYNGRGCYSRSEFEMFQIALVIFLLLIVLIVPQVPLMGGNLLLIL